MIQVTELRKSEVTKLSAQLGASLCNELPSFHQYYIQWLIVDSLGIIWHLFVALAAGVS